MFDTKTNSNMPNSMMVFTFSVSHGKAFFSANLVQNSKIVSLSWIMAHRLINDVNMHYSMVVFTFSVLDQKNSFRANLVQNLNILSLSENLAPTPIQIWKIYWQCYCLCFRPETYFWENFDNTKSNLSVSAEVWHQDQLEYAEFNGGVHFLSCTKETGFFGKFVPKNHNYHFQLKFSSKNYSNTPNLMVMFTFSVLDGKHYLWANFIQNINIVSFSSNLAPSLIGISEIQGWCSLFQFYTRNTLLRQIFSKSALLII